MAYKYPFAATNRKYLKYRVNSQNRRPKQAAFLCHRHSQTKQRKSQEIKALPSHAKISVAQKWQRNSARDQGILVAE